MRWIFSGLKPGTRSGMRKGAAMRVSVEIISIRRPMPVRVVSRNFQAFSFSSVWR